MNSLNFKNIAIIKLSALGDIVHAIPAFNTLRKHFPDSAITWFAEPTGANLLRVFRGIDNIESVNLKTGGPFAIIKNIRKVLSLYKNRFDLVIDFQGLIKSAVFASMLKGEIMGFDKENLREPLARFFYSRKAGYFDETMHVIFKNIHMVRELTGENKEKNTIEYPLDTLIMSPKLESFLDTNNLEEDDFVIVNIGGGWETKVLCMEQNIDVINRIKNKFKIVILWGNEKEKIRAGKISSQTGVLMSELFDFSDLVLFIEKSRLIVTADTLAMHLADVVGKPSVGIFGPTSPYRNGSLLKQSISVYEKLPCSFCYKKKCGKIDCIKNISIERIVESIDKVYGI